MKLFTVGAGVLMALASLGALSVDTHRMLDAQCVKRCNCTGSPCRGATFCQNALGEWTKCCNWCVL